MLITRDQYIKQVRSLLGPPSVPYVHAGRTRIGVDCVGVITLPLMELGVPFKDKRNYTNCATDIGLVSSLSEQLVPINHRERKPGDIVVLWVNKSTKLPQHVGVIVQSPKGHEAIVHAFSERQRVVENALGYWANRITHAFRLPSWMIGET